jgi:hypothetical protein
MSRRHGGPRRRRLVPVLGGTGAGRDLRLGTPLERALRAPLLDMQESIEDLAGVAARMTLPAPGAETLHRFTGQVQGSRQELTYLVAQALRRSTPIVEKTGVTPQVLLEGRSKQDILCRARRTATQAQNLAADGRLLLGAKFTYFFDHLMAWYQRKLVDSARPQHERMQLASDFARIDTIRFRLLSQVAERRGETAATKESLRAELGAEEDASAFLQARRQLDEGVQPDLPTLERALRHAGRLQLLAPSPTAKEPASSRPLTPPSERRTQPRP